MLVGRQNGTATLEDILAVFFFLKLNILFSYDPATLLLGIYPSEMKTHVHTKTCTWMFIATLFIIVKQKPETLKHPSTGEWINKLWHIHSVEYYLVIKRTNDWQSQQHGWISNALCWVKEACVKRLHALRLHSYDILEMAKQEGWRTGQWLPGVMWVGQELSLWWGSIRELLGGSYGTVLCLDCGSVAWLCACGCQTHQTVHQKNGFFWM